MSIKRNFSYNLILTVSSILFPLITFPFISHIIGPFGVGKIQFIVSFVQYFTLIAALGIPIYGVREVAKVRHDIVKLKKIVAELLLLNIITSVFLTIVYFIAVLSVHSLNVDWSYYIVASIMLLTGFCNVEWLFSGLEEFKFIALRSIVIKGISLILLLSFLKSDDDSIIYLWILVFSALTNNLWNIFAARKYLDPKAVFKVRFANHWKPIMYIFSTIAAMSIYALLDTIILGFIKGYEAVGFYTAAIRITKPAVPILTSLGVVLIPKISQAFRDNDSDSIKKYAASSMNFVIFLGVPISFGIIFLSSELIMFLCGKAFLPAVFCMNVFAIIILIIGLSNVWAIQILTPAGKDKYVTYSVVGGLCLNLVLNFILIPLYSYNGAVISNLITEVFVMCSFAYFANKFYKVQFQYKSALIAIAISLIFYPVLLLARKLFGAQHFLISLFTIIISIVIYFGIQFFVFKNEILVSQWNSMKNKFNL